MKFKAFLVLGALCGCFGCSKSDSLIGQANGDHAMHAHWKLTVSPVSGGRKHFYDVDLWTMPRMWHIHRVADEGEAMPGAGEYLEESDLVYDGTDVWQYGFKHYPKGRQPPAEASSGCGKFSSPSPEALALIEFWKVPKFPYDLEPGTQKVGERDCNVLVTTQLDVMRQECKIRCFIDPTDGIMRKRTDTSGADTKSSEALYATNYEIQDVQINPSDLKMDLFKYSPPAGVTPEVLGPVLKVW